MSKKINMRSHRTWAATLVVVLAAVTLGVSTVMWNVAPSSASVNNSPLGDAASVSSRIEQLHQRAMALSEAEDDDNYESGTSWGHAVTPEKAVTVAQQIARTSGLPILHTYIELQTRNGRPAYAIRFGAVTIYVDADLGTVVP